MKRSANRERRPRSAPGHERKDEPKDEPKDGPRDDPAPLARASHAPAPSVRQDTITLTLVCADAQWCARVTLGTASHDLGPHTSASAAMNAAMRFYYQQRPPSRRRGDKGNAD